MNHNVAATCVQRDTQMEGYLILRGKGIGKSKRRDFATAAS